MSARSIGDDLQRPFQLERSALRGRLVRLGGALDRILTRHDYPEPVGQLLGELLVLTAALAGGLRFKGTFSLQAKGSGPVSLLLADYTHDGALRGYARFDAARLADASGVALLGDGRLALTVDQGDAGAAYQSIVELTGASLTECMQTYFRQSEQLSTGLKVAVGRVAEGGRWRGGGVMVQRLADQPLADRDNERQEDWHRTMLLLGTATEAELLDPHLPADSLLYRLFHEEGVRVFTLQDVRFGCRCSRERVERLLRSFPDAELEEMRQDDGLLVVTCQFCNVGFRFDEGQLARLHGPAAH
ncbi:MAG TPA: Hsp33 family molecular chaperone HslO [Geminicoccaceae bacterium]|nr:Hsp33 family molecular chaperone HslO [Geminicoccaceae bacterium]